MTDRDRLAADLLTLAYDRMTGTSEQWANTTADRLIALGWTRLDGDLTILRAYKKGFQRGRNTLDEERLARALHDAEHRIDAEWWDSHPLSAAQDMEAHRRLAAAIAKAYREDTDAAR